MDDDALEQLENISENITILNKVISIIKAELKDTDVQHYQIGDSYLINVSLIIGAMEVTSRALAAGDDAESCISGLMGLLGIMCLEASGEQLKDVGDYALLELRFGEGVAGQSTP
jgi:hypothetical protein